MIQNNIEEMFDEISNRYDFLNNLISLGLHKIVKRYALSEMPLFSGAKVLDLCTGTGDMAGFVKEKYANLNVIGLDISSKMLDIAKEKYPDIKFIQGNASKMPFEDMEFDFIISTFGYRNIQDKEDSIKEIKRVLKENGYFLHLDFGKSPLMFVFDFIILFFARIFSKNYNAYKYLIKSKNEFSAPNKLAEEFKKAGFKPIKIKNLLFNIISYQMYINQ